MCIRDRGYTILAPQMAPYHFELLVPIFERFGYNVELLPSVDHGAVDAGLKLSLIHIFLGHGDERAGQAADAGAGHDAALLHGVVEHGERGRGARTAALAHADGFQDLGHGCLLYTSRCV